MKPPTDSYIARSNNYISHESDWLDYDGYRQHRTRPDRDHVRYFAARVGWENGPGRHNSQLQDGLIGF